jgi:tRNA threonylcarbamoyl adenosine modification protein YjeE
MNAHHAMSHGPAALSLHAAAPQATDAIGRALAPTLAPGDLVALHGPLGAGKSHLARAIVRARLGDSRAEVPSPTYTLVNVYAAPGGEIWHADLYRIDAEELAEIGLAEALGHAILLVEWPDRWTGLPARRLDIALAAAGEGREIAVTAHGSGWQSALDALRDAA